jgi:hypothetical protein
MKKLVLLASLLIFSIIVFAQSNPVKWTASATKQKSGDYLVTLVASVPHPWHIYSQNTPDGGPVPTKITFVKNPLVTLVGNVKEKGDIKNVKDKNFGVQVLYFDGDATFTQLVKVKKGIKTNIKTNINFMVCNDQQCLPPSTQEITVNLK